jgi:autotransporter-associated beta strand protein
MKYLVSKQGCKTVSLSRLLRSASGVFFTIWLIAASLSPAQAQDASWNGASTAFGDSANWTPATVPTGTATFTNTGSSNVDDSLGGISIGTIVFTAAPNAQAYTFNIDNSLLFGGLGITNNSTNTQTFNITSSNPAQVVFDNSSSASNGTGAVTINNSGFITFQNSSTAGSATIVNNEILTFTDNSSAGSAHITNNVETDFFTNASAGSANITNVSTLTFNNDASAASSTITNSNTLQFNNASTAGTASITNNNGAAITFSNTATGGGATFTNQSGGQIVFNDSSTAGTAASYNNSDQITFNNTSSGDGAGFTNNNGAHIDFNNGSSAGATASYGNVGVINFNNTSSAGNAGFSNSSGGQIFFNGTSSAGSASFTNTSTIDFNDGSTAGTALLTNNGSGTITFASTSSAGGAVISNNGTSEIVFEGTASAGSAHITNSGSFLDFSNSSTAGSAQITNNSSINFANSSTAGSAAIANNSGAFVNFTDSSTAGSAAITNNGGGLVSFFNLSTGGNAAITNNAGGVVDFAASFGPASNHQLSAGSIAGAGNFYLGANQLTVGGNNMSTTVSGVISDCGAGGIACSIPGATGGSLVKAGTGTLALSGINSYTGATTINGGTLEVDGAIANTSGLTVNSGGTLSGTGIVDPATTSIMSGGTLAPGNAANPTGTLTITGNLAFQSGAAYQVQVTPTTAASTRVSGTATLGGATANAVFANGSYISKTYTILTAAGGVSGTFGSLVNTNLPANFSDSLGYDANNAYLNLKLGFVIPGGLNVNQQNVANALTNFFNTTGGIPMVYGTLTPAALTQASGELATGAQQTTFDAMNLFLGLLTDPFVAGRGDGPSAGGGANGYADEANAYAGKRRPNDALAAIYTKAPAPVQTFEARWSTWIAGYGGSQTTDGNAALGSNNTTSSVYATAVGADYRFSPDTIAGFALAGGGTNFNVVGSGYGRSDLFQAGAFIRHTVGAAYISGALAYGWQDITTDRIVTAAGADHLRAEFNANAFSGRVEGGYRFISPWIGGVGITPYAAGQFTTFDLPAYAESALSGANTFALAYGAKDVTDTRSELGFRTDKSFAMQTAILTLRSRFAWAHDFNPDRSIAATFQTLPGSSFVVNGAAQASDSALTTASAELKWTNNWSVAGTFEGEFSSVTNSYAGKGVVRYQW